MSTQSQIAPAFTTTLSPKLPRPFRRTLSTRRPSTSPSFTSPSHRVSLSLPPPSEQSDKPDTLPDEDENTLHPSWHIYSQPGNPCVLCRGNGFVKCLYCFGDGVIKVGPEDGRDTLDCPQCQGSKTAQCLRCQGSGLRPSTRFDPVTGDTVRNPTNEEINRPKTQEELELQWKLEREAEREAQEKKNDTEGNGVATMDDGELVGEDRPLVEEKNIGNVL